MGVSNTFIDDHPQHIIYVTDKQEAVYQYANGLPVFAQHKEIDTCRDRKCRRTNNRQKGYKGTDNPPEQSIWDAHNPKPVSQERALYNRDNALTQHIRVSSISQSD